MLIRLFLVSFHSPKLIAMDDKTPKCYRSLMQNLLRCGQNPVSWPLYHCLAPAYLRGAAQRRKGCVCNRAGCQVNELTLPLGFLILYLNHIAGFREMEVTMRMGLGERILGGNWPVSPGVREAMGLKSSSMAFVQSQTKASSWIMKEITQEDGKYKLLIFY